MSWPIAIVALYGAGIVGAASPCVLPLLPGVVLVLADGRTGVGRALRMALFAGSAAATFAVFGAVVGSVHSAFSASTTARVAGIWLMVLSMATVAIDRGAVRLPQWNWPVQRAVAGWGKPLALGVGCGAVWSPCVGPLLGAAATAAANADSPWRGSLLLFAFGAGVVTPAVVLSLVPTPAVPRWARSAGVMARRVAPLAMAVLGLLLVTGRYVAVVQRLGSAT